MVQPLAIFAVIGAAILYLINDKFKKGDEKMHDTHDLIKKFHNDHVFMDSDQLSTLRDHRKANRNRVKTGLSDNDDPAPKRFVRQGSFAMRSIVQHPDNDYDIDDGVAFIKDDLVGLQGADKSALDARKMVLNALGDDKRFSKKPELKPNCIRVHYAGGYHIDMPVYRICRNDDDESYLELAGGDWKESNPEGVTEWFNEASEDRSPDKLKGGQLRRIVRLLKVFAKTVSVTKAPSGLIISVLAIDKHCYYPHEGRDDVSLYESMRLVYDRLVGDPDIYHPITGECLTEGDAAARMTALQERLEVALNLLQVLFEDDCDAARARKAWRKVFKHEFFDEEKKSERLTSTAGLGLLSSGQVTHVSIENPSKPWWS